PRAAADWGEAVVPGEADRPGCSLVFKAAWWLIGDDAHLADKAAAHEHIHLGEGSAHSDGAGRSLARFFDKRPGPERNVGGVGHESEDFGQWPVNLHGDVSGDHKYFL